MLIDVQVKDGLTLPMSDDPLHDHTTIRDRSTSDISSEKVALYSRGLELASTFSGMERELVETALFCAFQIHCNQFRSGTTSPHYSVHLLEVAERVNKNSDEMSAFLASRFADLPSHDTLRAIAVSSALLHDAAEDYSETLKRFGIVESADSLRTAVKQYLLNELSAVSTAGLAHAVVDAVLRLTIVNNDEFPEQSYLNGILASPIAHMVKLGDIDHNYETAFKFSPVWAITMGSCQVSALASNTPYQAHFEDHIKRCLEHFDHNEMPIWETAPTVSTWTKMVEQLKRYEGDAALIRGAAYLHDLSLRCSGLAKDRAQMVSELLLQAKDAA